MTEAKAEAIGKEHLEVPVGVRFGGREINGVESRGGSNLRGPLRKQVDSLPLPLGEGCWGKAMLTCKLCDGEPAVGETRQPVSTFKSSRASSPTR